MGFSKFECLKSLRAVVASQQNQHNHNHNHNQPQALEFSQIIDETMLHVITEREESDELQKVDIARLESENEKERMREVNNRREQKEISEFVGTTATTTTDRILKMFTSSFLTDVGGGVRDLLADVLSENSSSSQGKALAIQLLSLERDSIKVSERRASLYMACFGPSLIHCIDVQMASFGRSLNNTLVSH